MSSDKISALKDLWRTAAMIVAALGLVGVLATATACEKGPAEEAGEAIDEAAEDVGRAIDDATD